MACKIKFCISIYYTRNQYKGVLGKNKLGNQQVYQYFRFFPAASEPANQNKV